MVLESHQRPTHPAIEAPATDERMTLNEVADMARCRRSRVLEAVDNGALPAERNESARGRSAKVLIRSADAAAWLSDGKPVVPSRVTP